MKNFFKRNYRKFKKNAKALINFFFDNFLKFCLMYVFGALTLFVMRILDIYELYGHYPSDLTMQVIAVAGVEAVLALIIRLNKSKSCDDDSIADKIMGVRDRLTNRNKDEGDGSFG